MLRGVSHLCMIAAQKAHDWNKSIFSFDSNRLRTQHTVHLRGMRTSKHVPNATWTRSTPEVQYHDSQRALWSQSVALFRVNNRKHQSKEKARQKQMRSANVNAVNAFTELVRERVHTLVRTRSSWVRNAFRCSHASELYCISYSTSFHQLSTYLSEISPFYVNSPSKWNLVGTLAGIQGNVRHVNHTLLQNEVSVSHEYSHLLCKRVQMFYLLTSLC